MRARQQVLMSAAACAVAAMFAPAARAQYQPPDATFAPPPAYYDSATGTTAATLKPQLHNIIDGHLFSSYDDARQRLAVLDQDPNNPSNVILVYSSGISVDATWDAGVTWNREHLWPDSLGIDGGGIDMGDLFNLRACDPDVNSTRGNKYYDNATGPLPAAHQSKAPDARMSSTAWNPPPNEHGDIARAMFYMDTRYDGTEEATTNLTLTDSTGSITTSNSNMGVLSSLLRWHYQDGITNAERKRNDQIHDLYQGNRNPFVDRPELVWAVFGGGNNNSKLYVGAAAPAPANGASSASVNLRVITGAAAWGSSSLTLNKAGANPTTYDVTTGGDATSAIAGAGQTIDYNTQTRTIQVSLNGPTGAIGAGTVSGTVTIDNTDITTGGAGLGAQDGNDTITVTGSVLDHAQPSFIAGASAAAQSVDFDYVPAGGIVRSATFAVHNRPAAAGAALTAGLDVDGVAKTGSALMSTTVTASNPATPLAADASRTYNVNFTPGPTEGPISATHTIATSDENIPGATARPNLVLTTTGRVTAGNFPVSGNLLLFAGETFTTNGFNLADGASVTKLGAGTMNVNGVQSHGATAQLVASEGPVNFLTDSNSTAASGLKLEVIASPVTFQSRQHLRGLALQGVANATVAPHGDHALVAGTLEISSGARLNLNDNELIVRNASAGVADSEGAYDGIQGQVQRGYNFGSWDGNGIVTTTADSALGLTTIGVGTAAGVLGLEPGQQTLWSGEMVNASDVLAMYTYAGDANLDGQIDAGDYGVLDYFVQIPFASGYANGDFNYDGFIDPADYGTIDNGMQFQGPPLASSVGGAAGIAGIAAVSAVPEPGVCGLALLTAFMSRRRRRPLRRAC